MQRCELESNGYDTSDSVWRAVQDWATCLKEAFLASQADLLRLAASEGLQLSGSHGPKKRIHNRSLDSDIRGEQLVGGPLTQASTSKLRVQPGQCWSSR